MKKYSITGTGFQEAYFLIRHSGTAVNSTEFSCDTLPTGAFAAGVQSVYPDGETDTAAKLPAGLQPGDTLEFLCGYYSYAGDYQDSCRPGEPLTVTEDGLTVSDVLLEGRTRASYRFTDLYSQHCWTAVIPEE